MSNIGICTCEGNINNLGKPNCLVELQAPDQLWFALRTKTDGTANVIDPTATLDQAYFETFLHADEAKNRFLPLKGVKNFTPEQDDDTTDEASDGSIEIINQGIVRSTYTVWCKDPYKLKAKLETLKCLELGAFTIDRSGNIIGEETSDGKLAGRKIAVNTLSVKVMPKSDEGTNKIEISFDYERSSTDSKVDYILSSDIVSPYSLNDVAPLQDVNIEIVGTPSTTDIDFKLFLDYGSLSSRIPVEGLTTSNLEGFDTIGTTTVTFATVTEPVTGGTYNATFSAETSGDILRVQGKTTTVQSGFDLKRVPTVLAPAIP